jgi:hypothetical protein
MIGRETNTSTNNTAPFTILNGQALLYPLSCLSHTAGTVIAKGAGASFKVATPGTYIIGLKYQSSSLPGTPAPMPSNITYMFDTSVGEQASILLEKS